MRCGADLRCGSEYSDKTRCGPEPKILNVTILWKALRIYCGSAAGPLTLAGPLFIYTVSLRIYCGSAAGPLILAGPLFIIVFRCGSAANLLRDRWFLRAHCLYSVSLRICCGSAAGPLILAGPPFIYTVSLRICCGSAAGPLILAGPLFIKL